MARYKRFTFLCNSTEEDIISNIADRLGVSRSGAVRYSVRKVAHELNIGGFARKEILPENIATKPYNEKIP